MFFIIADFPFVIFADSEFYLTGRESITPASYCWIAAASLPVTPATPSQSALIFACSDKGIFFSICKIL